MIAAIAPARAPRSTWRILVGHPSAAIGLALLAIVVTVAVFAHDFAPYSPVKQDLRQALASPTRPHLFGTDAFGRDVLSRVFHGARVSLSVGALVVGIALTVGAAMGLAAAHYGGMIDEALSRLTDILLAFPGFLLALVVLAILGPSLTNAMLAVAIASIPSFMRVVRGSALSERAREYILASEALGCSNSRIMFRHLLPNIVGPLLVLTTLRAGTAILTTASLSFLGLGAQPPTPEWGEMLASGRTYVRTAWWITFFPGMAIALTVLALNQIGDGLRDVLDPKLRRQR